MQGSGSVRAGTRLRLEREVSDDPGDDDNQHRIDPIREQKRRRGYRDQPRPPVANRSLGDRPKAGEQETERERSEAWLLVRGFADTLDDTRRAVFGAVLLEGLSAAETADATGLNVTTVQHRVRALRRSFERWVEAREREP